MDTALFPKGQANRAKSVSTGSNSTYNSLFTPHSQKDLGESSEGVVPEIEHRPWQGFEEILLLEN